jgi:hypothetical protein
MTAFKKREKNIMSASTISRKARLFFADKKRTAAEICITYAQDFDSVRKGD